MAWSAAPMQAASLSGFISSIAPRTAFANQSAARQPSLLKNARNISLLNSPDLRFVARDGIRASKDGRAGGLRGLLGTKLRWDQRKDSFTQGSARNAGGS